MKVPNLLLACYLMYGCQAGPLIIVGGAIADIIFGASETAMTAFFSSGISSLFGVGASGIWFGDYVIINGALYYGSAVVGAGVLAGGAAAGGACGAGKCKPVTGLNAAQSKSLMSMISSASVQSVSSVSAHSVSLAQQIATGAKSAIASMESQAAVQQSYDTANNPFTFSEHHKRTAAPAVTSSIGQPPGTPVSTLPAAQRPTEIPAGVPEYNFRMCQHDIIQMGIDKKNITIDQPGPGSILVSNIPSTCMVLASVMMGNPALGPHPIPMGSASLQWNGMPPDKIDVVRIFLGLPPTDPKANQTEIVNRFFRDAVKAHP